MSDSHMSRFNFEKGFVPYWNTLCLNLGIAMVGGLLMPVIGYRSVGFLFLSSVTLVGTFGTARLVLFASILSSVIWEFFFIPPRFHITIASHEDQILCASYFVAALITGAISLRAHRRKN